MCLDFGQRLLTLGYPSHCSVRVRSAGHLRPSLLTSQTVCVCKLQTPNMDKVHEVMHNPTKMSQMMAATANMPSFVADKMSRTYASWLQWWKSTVTGDDYMKYLSTLVSLSS